jgi:hypothetical protein
MILVGTNVSRWENDMRVKAIEKTYYDRQDRMPGDVFEMDDRESVQIKILSVLGKIEVLNASEKTQAPSYTAKIVEAEEEEPRKSGAMTTEGDSLTPRRVYRRRDMRAER